MENKIIIGTILIAALTACTGPKSANNAEAGSQSPVNLPYIQASVAVTISKGSTTVYSDSSPNSSLVLNAGQAYNFNLSVQNAPAGTTYHIVMTNIDLINGSPVTVPLNAGNNV